MRTSTYKHNLCTLCIHIIIGYAEYGIPIQHQTTIHFVKQRSNSAQQKIDLFYGVYLSKHFPARESLEIASTFFSLATLKFSLLLTQTQGKDFGSYGYRGLTCNIRMMMFSRQFSPSSPRRDRRGGSRPPPGKCPPPPRPLRRPH